MVTKVTKRPVIGDAIDKMWEPEARRLQKLAADLSGKLADSHKTIEMLQTTIRELNDKHSTPPLPPDVVDRTKFYHSGDLGDIIYACPAIRALGGGVLVLGPDLRHPMSVRERMTPEKVSNIAGLLKQQEYIAEVTYSEKMPKDIDCDLNKMRSVFGSREWHPRMNLAELHLRAFGLPRELENHQWLHVTPSPETAGRIIISRSARYHNPEFRWSQITAMGGDRLLFIGTPKEHQEFMNLYGAVERLETSTLLDVAMAIAGADLFVGNQSCPRAIAEGLKVDCIVEGFRRMPNTHFDRPGCFHAYNDEPLTVPPIKVRKPRHGGQSNTEMTIHRGAAFGDVIMASAIASRLHEQGISVRFSCEPEVYPALHRHPHILSVAKCPNPQVNLDGAYEKHPDRKNRRIVELMAESAREQLAKHGIAMDGNHNLTPILCASKEEIHHAEQLLEKYPRPFVVFNPTSNAWINKTVARSVWEKVECQGTKIWLGTGEAPDGYVDLKVRHWRALVGIIAIADLCVSVDTGPLHVAAGLGIPTVAIEQANSLAKRILGDQTDWSSVGRQLDCLGCAEMECPIDKNHPPCSYIEAAKINEAIAQKLSTVTGQRISAIIPVLRPHPRLLRCIDAVKDQVDEIVITLDGDAKVDGFIPKDPKIVVIKNPTGRRTGCGHTMGRAIRHSTGRYLLLLNDDAYADPNSVGALKRAMTGNVAVVGALTRYGNGMIYHGGTVRNGVGFGHIDHNRPAYMASITSRREMEFVNLAFAMVLREAYFDVHGFDQRYDCYSEDSDFCLSVRKAGWKVMYEPASTAIHDEAQSTTSAEKWALLKDGNTKLMRKWWSYFQRNKHNQLGTFA